MLRFSGRYEAVNAIVGVKDFVGQVLPSPEERAPGGNGRAVGELLRRAKEYDVRLLEVPHPVWLVCFSTWKPRVWWVVVVNSL